MRFFLGVHRPQWLPRAGVPLFVSHAQLRTRRTLPEAAAPWALDSGAYTVLNRGAWWIATRSPYPFTPVEYAADVRRYEREIGLLEWAAPMDWPCEPGVVWKQGSVVAEHQRRTVANFLELRELLGGLVIPVLQGWEQGDYERCVDLYELAGVDLAAEAVVGVGSVCRRYQDDEIARVLRRLEPYGLNLHGFGLRASVIRRCRDLLTSADSMAWSFDARMKTPPLPGHEARHKSCQNCLEYAIAWRERLLEQATSQLTIGEVLV